MKRVFVAGHKGMVGSAIVRQLQQDPAIELVVCDRSELNLLDQLQVRNFFLSETIDAVYLAAAKVGGGCKPIEDDALLDEVTALVERPNVLVCEFEPQFLGVPQECLILTMKANQKYFPLLDAQGRLTNRFLVVSNITPDDASAVIGGNERVVRPRLADAKFFFDQDRKKTLASRVEGLGKVVYHNKLGTQGERMERVRAIARALFANLRAVIVDEWHELMSSKRGTQTELCLARLRNLARDAEQGTTWLAHLCNPFDPGECLLEERTSNMFNRNRDRPVRVRAERARNPRPRRASPGNRCRY